MTLSLQQMLPSKQLARFGPPRFTFTGGGGHFDPYVEPLFSEIIEEQLAFLRKEVSVK